MGGEETEGGGDAPRMIQAPRCGYANLTRLLDLLGHEIDLFDRAGKPDYEIVEAILAYCLGYPGECHHPKEDAVLAKPRTRDADAAAAGGALEGEHRELGALTRQLADSVDRVLMEAEIPRDWLTGTGRRFVIAYRPRMEHEEATSFPAAARGLAPQDWAEIAERMADPKDRLFGIKTEKRFEALRQDIQSLASRQGVEAQQRRCLLRAGGPAVKCPWARQKR
jgi:hemerythrin-like domain-containing protein